MVIYLAALQSVPHELHEAAAIDGASALGRFLHITIPLIAPVTAFIVVTWTIGALQMFTQAYVMTGGGPVGTTTTIVYRLYEEAFLFLQLGRASAMAMLFLVAVAALGVFGRRFIAGKEA
jgi:ABC-type sugar transport system permease subunit